MKWRNDLGPNKWAVQRRRWYQFTEHGFTLVELMIVVVIIGILSSIVGINVLNRLREAKVNAAKTQIANLENGVKHYYIKCGRYPTTEQGLDALVANPTIGRPCKNYPPNGIWDKSVLPRDPWDLPYQYAYPGTHNTGGVDIWSLGEDGEPETSDDIGNWERPVE